MELIVENIGSANAEFEREMTIRINAEAQNENLNAAQQRKHTEGIYLQIVQKINAISVIQPNNETENCTDLINALIDEYNRTIASMRTSGSGNEKRKKKETPNNADQPEHPETDN